MTEAVTIEDLSQALDVVAEMQGDQAEGSPPAGGDWLIDYRQAAAVALVEQLEAAMAERVDAHLARMAETGTADRRNGTYRRHLMTELGEIELHVPRTRRFSAMKVVRRYARRAPQIDQMILACFVLGLSTRKVAHALLPILGRKVSPGTVSAVARQLDAAVKTFHRRPLGDHYSALILDGVVVRRKTGAGAMSRPVLVALGMLPDGRKEVIDYQLAPAESSARWEGFLTSLHRRGLTGDKLDLIAVDGGKGLEAALPVVFPGIPVQRCWAHKIRNILNKVRQADHNAVKAQLHRIMNAPTEAKARSKARAFADRWAEIYPKAVHCLRRDLDDLLTCWMYKDPEQRKRVRTTNAIERRFKEVRRRTRPMDVFQDRTSMDRILFAVFIHENKSQGIPSQPLLTHNS